MLRSVVPLIPTPPAMDRDAEIDQINRELEILRTRYALYDRMGRVLKVYFAVITPLIAGALLALAIKFVLVDALSGLFLTGVLLILGLVIFLLVRNSDLRWIDVASQIPRTTNPYFYSPAASNLRFFLLGRLPSDAQIIEQQIADRDQRLSELPTRVAGSTSEI
jgi:hypothetical protein